MSTQSDLGGIIHTYLGYDPVHFPSPTAPPPDLATPAMEHLLTYGNTRRLTDEELANAVRIDPSQIRGLGPSLDAIAEMLRERKRKILATYETTAAQTAAHKAFHEAAESQRPPKKLADRFDRAVMEEQLHDLENLYYAVGDDRDPFARSLVGLAQKLGDKYQVDALAAKYEFTGRQGMSVPKALEIKEELETIDKLLEQIEEAKKTARVGIIDMDELSEFVNGEDMEGLRALQQQINEYLRDQAERQGITQTAGIPLTRRRAPPFQSRILTTIFNELQESKSGRHPDAVTGEGAVESQRTKPYEFGIGHPHGHPGTMINAMVRMVRGASCG